MGLAMSEVRLEFCEATATGQETFARKMLGGFRLGIRSGHVRICWKLLFGRPWIYRTERTKGVTMVLMVRRKQK